MDSHPGKSFAQRNLAFILGLTIAISSGFGIAAYLYTTYSAAETTAGSSTLNSAAAVGANQNLRLTSITLPSRLSIMTRLDSIKWWLVAVCCAVVAVIVGGAVAAVYLVPSKPVPTQPAHDKEPAVDQSNGTSDVAKPESDGVKYAVGFGSLAALVVLGAVVGVVWFKCCRRESNTEKQPVASLPADLPENLHDIFTTGNVIDDEKIKSLSKEVLAEKVLSVMAYIRSQPLPSLDRWSFTEKKKGMLTLKLMYVPLKFPQSTVHCVPGFSKLELIRVLSKDDTFSFVWVVYSKSLVEGRDIEVDVVTEDMVRKPDINLRDILNSYSGLFTAVATAA
jgi:hypothetical protein